MGVLGPVPDMDWDSLAFCAVRALTLGSLTREYADYLTQAVEQVKIEYGPDA